MRNRHFPSVWRLAVASGLISGLVIGGCGGVEEEEPEPIMETRADDMFPIMLHNQPIRGGGFSWRVKANQVSDVEVIERSEQTPDGSQTAVVSFKAKRNGLVLDVKASLTYKIEKMAADNGSEIVSFPVTSVKTLSVERANR